MKSGYVYCLRFRSTQFYVGSSSNPIQRLQAHRQSCLGKKQINKFMSNVWKKYGEPELYILSKVPVELLQQEEQKFIDLVFGKEGCLNLNPYADRPPGFGGRKHTKEHKESIASWASGTQYWKGRKHTEETKAKIASANRNKPKTEEHKEKLRKPKTAEHKAKLSVATKKYFEGKKKE